MIQDIKQDPDYELMVVSALRYALTRHSYIVGTTQEFVKRNWSSLSKMHWCILKDIREHIEWCDLTGEEVFDMDLRSWIEFYNSLISRNDVNLPDSHYDYLLKPITKTLTVKDND